MQNDDNMHLFGLGWEKCSEDGEKQYKCENGYDRWPRNTETLQVLISVTQQN